MENVESPFRLSKEFDALLRELNECLSEPEEKLISDFSSPDRPVLFIVGPPRSGTTLLMQILAATKGFCYPSNFLSRFYQNVYLGAQIEKVMKTVLPETSSSFDSFLGKTKNWNEPNEFGFFWEYYFPLKQYHQLNDDELGAVNIKRLKSELAAMQHVYKLPVAMKAMIINYHLPFLHKHLPKAIFLRLHRSYIDLASSLLDHRRKVFGDPRKWLSCKPRNWHDINKLDDPAEQVVAQLQTIECALDEAERQIPSANWINIKYEEMCNDTPKTIGKILEGIALIDQTRLDCSFNFPHRFQCRKVEVDDELHSKICFYLNRYNLPSG